MEQQVVVLVPLKDTFAYYPKAKDQKLDWLGQLYLVPFPFLSSVPQGKDVILIQFSGA